MPLTSAVTMSRPASLRDSASDRMAGSVVDSAWFAGFHIGSKSSTCIDAPFNTAAAVADVRNPSPSTGASGVPPRLR